MQPEQACFFEKLYREYYLLLLNQAEKKLGDPVLAQDIVQDTFFTGMNRIEILMAHENPIGWLTMVMHYKIMHNFEKLVQEQRFFAEKGSYDEPDYMDANIQALETGGGEMMSKIQESLTEEEFHYITRLVLDGLSHQQLGEELHITESGSKKKRERIIKKLNKKFPGFSENISEKNEKEKV